MNCGSKRIAGKIAVVCGARRTIEAIPVARKEPIVAKGPIPEVGAGLAGTDEHESGEDRQEA
jgi:hypothetical protein